MQAVRLRRLAVERILRTAMLEPDEQTTEQAAEDQRAEKDEAGNAQPAKDEIDHTDLFRGRVDDPDDDGRELLRTGYQHDSIVLCRNVLIAPEGALAAS